MSSVKLAFHAQWAKNCDGEHFIEGQKHLSRLQTFCNAVYLGKDELSLKKCKKIPFSLSPNNLCMVLCLPI